MGDYLNCGRDVDGIQTIAVALNQNEVTQQDRIRERELFRFYRPSDATPTEPDGQSSPSSTPHPFDSNEVPPITNNDVTLAALAQLVALRLGVHRAMINVIGRESQYTLVESTKTLDLVQQTSSEADGDGAWVGSGGKLHKSMSICESVVALPNETLNHPFLIVPDLTQDERFKDRPYVRGYPSYRFYAGTQLRTVRGVVIGALCAFAHEPRTLSETEKTYMGTISETIMQHLEMKRAAAERDKVTRMSRGLNAFVEGKTSQFTPVFDGKAAQDAVVSNGFTASKSIPEGGIAHRTTLGADEPSTSTTIGHGDAQQMPIREGGEPSKAQEPVAKAPEAPSEPSKTGIEEQFQATLSRAAGLLGEALGLRDGGGAVFYDTLPRIDTPNSDISGTTSPLEGKDPDDFGSFSDGATTPGTFDATFESDESRAPILGATVSARYDASNPDVSYRKFTSRMLSKFLKRYPSGRTWEFDEHGMIPTQDEGITRQDPKSRQTAAEREVRQKIESDYLMSTFPGVRSLVFVPLWDANLSRHYASCFAWTTDSMTRFSADVEFSFVTAFGNSISAEISRLATIDADQRKSDFIGSISHELRSPLHGVLASAEFLAETNVDSFQSTLVNTIDSCGRTLLDTINHVLDFSKINSLRRTWKKTQRTHRTHTPHGSRDQKGIQSSGIMSILGSTDLAAITEEVVDSIYAGKIYAKAFSPADITDVNASGTQRRDSEQPRWQDSAKSGVQVSLDIAPGDYHFITQPGAIRRIIMNIFGNALKYTEKGSIVVRLWQQGEYGDVNGKHKVILTVKDTGKGISTGYLRTRLFTPFAQENDLAPGTGLGLSIVRNIVTMLRGDINIRSKVGRGTEVKVTLPNLMRPQTNQSLEDKEPVRSTLVDFAFLKTQKRQSVIALYGFTPDQGYKFQEVERTLRRYLEDWCGMTCIVEMTQGVRADVIIVDERLLDRLEHSGLVGSDDNTVVLCKNPAPVQSPKGTTSRYFFLLKPFGPYKLARTIRKCLERPHSGRERPISLPPALNAPTPDTQNYEPIVPSSSANAEMAVKGAPKDQIECSYQNKATDSPIPSFSSASAGIDISLRGLVGSSSSENAIDDRKDGPNQSVSLPGPSEQAQTAVEDAQRMPKILVVDDNKTNLVLLQTFLKKRGLPSDSASDGGMAVKEATAQQYDIIFMDISMPVLNGFEATREIRKHEENMRKQFKRESGGGKRSRPSSKVWQHGPVTMTPSPSQHQHQHNASLGNATNGVGPTIPTKPVTPPISPEEELVKDAMPPAKAVKPALIIALTGLASGRDQSEAFTSGVDLYMTKPVSFKEVGRLIDNWMANGGLVAP